MNPKTRAELLYDITQYIEYEDIHEIESGDADCICKRRCDIRRESRLQEIAAVVYPIIEKHEKEDENV